MKNLLIHILTHYSEKVKGFFEIIFENKAPAVTPQEHVYYSASFLTISSRVSLFTTTRDSPPLTITTAGLGILL